MMKLPVPLVVETRDEGDPATGELDSGPTSTTFAASGFFTPESLVVYAGSERREYEITGSPSEVAGEFVAPKELGSVKVRGLDPYDGLVISPKAGVPQPLRVLKRHVLQGGGVAAQELTAVVADDNSVATLVLDTGDGVFVRYSGDWHRLTDDSDALDGAQIVTVESEALDVFDKADAAKATCSIFDLPRFEGSTQVLPDTVQAAAAAAFPLPGDLHSPLVASGTSIPLVDTPEDLEIAISYAQTHPSSRWYVAKRAQSLGLAASIPEEWLPRPVVSPF